MGVQAAPVSGSTQGAVWAATGFMLNAGMRIAARKTIMKTPDKDFTEPIVLFPIFLSLVMSRKYI